MTQIYNTYQININRAKNFIHLYEIATENRGRGRTDTLSTDILRAGVVFLHSTFEEYLRSVILERKIQKLSESKTDFVNVLSNVNLVGDNTGKSNSKKYLISDFYEYREETINKIVNDSLRDKISYMTFNDYSQIVSSLKDIGIEFEENHNPDGIIDTYIKRRHKIVHEADKNLVTGRGNYQTSAINAKMLETWINAVDAFVQDIEAKVSIL